MKEAAARIKINKLLEAAGWRFFAENGKPGNIQLEPKVNLKPDELGDDFDKVKKGFVDFLLLDDRGKPFIVLEAKAELRNPLDGKEQARTYARSLNCRFIILSNGNLHYFWDLERGNPGIITSFPSPASVIGFKQTAPDASKIVEELIKADYVVLTQRPQYEHEAAWKNEDERPDFISKNGLRFLRPYQIKALQAIQSGVKDGKDRFLLEMATGTGKTLTSAAIIKLFLRTRNARRVLFLVDRLELEDQALKAFRKSLASDYKSVIYKENRDDWRHAEIVVSTVQSLLFNNKYQRLFSPTDFDLVISDEAHRCIGGNARAVFDYFVGYKLGLTATPRDYLKHFDRGNSTDPREFERRLILDTYRTFGCDDGHPTFRYTLLDGVRDGFLINPTVVDARTQVTAQLLSEEGFIVAVPTDGEGEVEQSYTQRQFEKRFFSEATNQLLCKTFLENGLRDPVSNEFGKSIVFAVSQAHASKLVEIFNKMADQMYPGRYQSDFAIQVTSSIAEAQQYTINFTNNVLRGKANVLHLYHTSKARICVTVGMMTTGYDCPDLLNLGLFRPVFSPTDFIQIKGRGTRKHDFREQLFDEGLKQDLRQPHKTAFKLFDFFANCEYFEEDYQYDQVLKLPRPAASPEEGGGEPPPPPSGEYEHKGQDALGEVREETIGAEGMRIDRMFLERFEDAVRANQDLVAAVTAGHWDTVIDYINKEVFDKPSEFYNLENLRKAADCDRRIGLKEILQKVFGLIPGFKSKNELLEEEFAKFLADTKPTEDEVPKIPIMKSYFKAYATNSSVRDTIESGKLAELATNPFFSSKDLRNVPERYRKLIPDYIKDYVPLNQFTA